MNKTMRIIIFTLLVIVLAVIPTSFALADDGWNDCREGRTNCLYPGHCHEYTDTNNDGICDHSQSAPTSMTANTATTSPATTQATTSATTATAITIYPSGAAAAEVSSVPISSTEDTETSNAARSRGSIYYLVPVLVASCLLYGLSYLLAARRVIKLALHRKIWNSILLVTFFISAVLGLLLVLRLDFNIDIPLPFNQLFWHVEAGIVMGAVAALHIGWHWRYFQKMLKPSG